jgi:ABC-type sugar transport system substrate-binding protein
VLANRAKGIQETLNREARGITVLGPFETFSEPTQNYSAWSSQVNAHPDALAFLGVGDADSSDLARLRQETNGKWLSAGFDVDAKTLQAVKAGQNFITMDPEHYLKGYISSWLLIDSVKTGKKLPEGWFVSPGFVVDSSNVDEIIAREASRDAAFTWYEKTINDLLADPAAHVKPMNQAT